MMIWIGTKHLGVPAHSRIYVIDRIRWYYTRRRVCDRYGCWNYILFRR